MSLVRLGLLCLCLLATGCHDDSATSQSSRNGSPTENGAKGPTTVEEYLRLAVRRERTRDYAAAADAVNKALLQQPENDEAKLIAARIERLRGNLESAAEIAESVELKARPGKEAVELRFAVLVELERPDDAVDTLLSALDNGLDVPEWRHQAWELLNEVGRRAEACRQALALCRQGIATERELLSLVMRAHAFPTPGMLPFEKEGDRLFQSGLGKARWYFSMDEFGKGLAELEQQHQNGFRTVEAEALYGRLLGESQLWDEFREWTGKASRESKTLADYWAAIGNFFYNHHRYEAAVNALLETIRRDPTDRVSLQRLVHSLTALDRHAEAQRLQEHSTQINLTEDQAMILYVVPEQQGPRQLLLNTLMALRRPFETLEWMEVVTPPNQRQQRLTIEQQRRSLVGDPSTSRVAANRLMADLDPADFDIDSAWKDLLASDGRDVVGPAVPNRDILATPRLVNVAEELGLPFQWYTDVETDLKMIPIHEAMGGGIAVLDFDLDGLADIYFAQGSGDPPTDQCTRSNQLFRGGRPRFVDVTFAAQADDFNYSSGLAAGDVNQDGFPDLYLGSLGRNRLLINNGDGTFSDATAQLGDVADRFSTSLGIADINGDGLPDLFESNYIEMDGGFALPRPQPNGMMLPPSPRDYNAASDRWFENLANGRFRSHEIPSTTAETGTSLGLLITDIQPDGKNEVFVANDVRPNHLLFQTGDNEFKNLANVLGVAIGFDGAAKGCMGIAAGDFNRDGKFDLQIANYLDEAANLYLQNEQNNFMDFAERYRLADATRPYVGFGTKAVDFDRNGFLDFIVSNGHVFDMREFNEAFQMPPQVLMSDGRRLESVKVDDPSGYWDGAYLGRTVASLDYDRDGGIDLLIGHLDQPAALLHNETAAGGGWLQIEVVGRESERDAIGAVLVLTVGESRYTEWVTAGDGYLCSDEPIVAFGIDSADPTGDLEIRWPSGLRQNFDAVTLGHRYLVVEGDAVPHAR